MTKTYQYQSKIYTAQQKGAPKLFSPTTSAKNLAKGE